MMRFLRSVGGQALDRLANVGRSTMMWATAMWGLPGPGDVALVLKQIYHVGVLSLIIIVVYLRRLKRGVLPAMVPMVFLLVMTIWAMLNTLGRWWFADSPNYFLGLIGTVVLIAAIWMALEAYVALGRPEMKAAEEGSRGSLPAALFLGLSRHPEPGELLHARADAGDDAAVPPVAPAPGDGALTARGFQMMLKTAGPGGARRQKR